MARVKTLAAKSNGKITQETRRIMKEEMLQEYASRLPESRNKSQYIGYARDFLEHADTPNRAAVENYIQRLQRRGWRPGSIKLAFSVIRRLFVVNGLKWEFRHGEAPQIGQRDEYRPQLSMDIIATMVEAAISGKLHEDETCFLALSTIYAVRKEEIRSLKPEDINLGAHSIYIATVHRGRERYHLVPPEIEPYLAAHDFATRYSLTGAAQVFWRVVNNSGLETLKQYRLGWHAIRRSMWQGLNDNGCPPLLAHKFMRWKGATPDLAMPARYYGNVVIGMEGTAPFMDEAKGDEEVFEKYHPFLNLWKGG